MVKLKKRPTKRRPQSKASIARVHATVTWQKHTLTAEVIAEVCSQCGEGIAPEFTLHFAEVFAEQFGFNAYEKEEFIAHVALDMGDDDGFERESV